MGGRPWWEEFDEKKSYRKGISLEHLLADIAVDDFLEEEELRQDYLDSISVRMRDHDASFLIDHMVSRLRRENDSWISIDTLLSPIISRLYRDHDLSQIDMRRFQKIAHVASELHGTQEHPITLSYAIPDSETTTFGMHASYCRLDLRGQAKAIGDSARHSSFHVRDAPLVVGAWASHSDFYIETGERRFKLIEYYGTCMGGVPLYVPGFTSLEHHFWQRGNRLFIPDGTEWKELRLKTRS